MITLPYIAIQLTTNQTINAHGNSLRGYIGNTYDIASLCNRTPDGSLRYRAPVVQYKILDGKANIVGLGEGVEALKEIALDMHELTLENICYKVIERDIDYRPVEWNVCHEPQTYKFLTPWLALNEHNYSRYIRSPQIDRRAALMKRVLVGNLLSISKALGVHITDQINVTAFKMEEVTNVYLKGTPMLGFRGMFTVNFQIPSLWGIGKSASRGFGTIQSR